MARIAIGGFQHETNTFAPSRADYAAFEAGGGWPGVQYGEPIFGAVEGTNIPAAGAVQALRVLGHDLVGTAWAAASPSAHVTADAFEKILNELIQRLKGVAPVDGVYLDLHGAMVAETFDDGEGEILRRVRETVGPRVPVVASLDLHANVTRAMVERADALVAYRTYPHVDMAETGQRAGRTLLRALDGLVQPVMAWGSRPMMTSTLVHAPSRQPMKDIMDMAIAAEASGAVLNASVFGGFPHADIPHTSLSAVIVCDRNAEPGRALLDRLLGMAWDRRDAFLYSGAPLASQIAHARTLGAGPIVLVDHGDNTASGGTQDVMSVIEETMRQGLEDVAAGPICDPAAVKRIVEAGTAAGVTLPLGGRIDMPQINLAGKPLTVTGKVTRITDGEFVVTGPMATGTRVRMGRTAVLDTGAMQIVVAERRSEPFDLGVFTHCGIDPRRKRYVLIKSRQHFRAGFEPIARHIVLCDGDGCTSSDLALFTYRNRRRPLYPFETA